MFTTDHGYGYSRQFFFPVLLSLVFVWANTAHAACRIEDDYGAYQGKELLYYFPRTVVIPRNLPIGAIIARSPITTMDGTRKTLRCNAGDLIYQNQTAARDVIFDDTYGQLLHNGQRAGVAYRILRSDGTALHLNVSERPLTTPSNNFSWGTKDEDAMNLYDQMVLVKTAENILPGTMFSAGTKLTVTARWSGGGPAFEAAILSTSYPVTLVPQTCQITMPSAVALGSHRSSSFSGIGSTSSAIAFEIQVDCTGVSTAVHMTMSDPTNNGNTSDRLSLSQGSQAKGIGVQILRNDRPVALGPDSTAPGTRNQFKLFDATASTPRYTAQFQARYIQTAQTVAPGSANSAVTIAMSYQ